MFSAPRTCVPSSLLIGELIHGRGPAQQTGTTSLVAGTVLGLRTRQIDVACSRPDLQRRWVHYRAPRADQSSLNPRSAPWSRTAPWSQAAAGSGSTGELMDAIRPQIFRQREMPEPAAPGAVADASVSRDMTRWYTVRALPPDQRGAKRAQSVWVKSAEGARRCPLSMSLPLYRWPTLKLPTFGTNVSLAVRPTTCQWRVASSNGGGPSVAGFRSPSSPTPPAGARG